MAYFDNFFDSYENLKFLESWNDILELGNKALDENLSTENNALINVRLTSTLFYLGQKQQALITATYALGNASIAENVELEARSLYLLSACHRALDHQEDALFYINLAQNHAKNHDISELTKLKIYFNTGALFQDLYNNPVEAQIQFLKVKEICSKILSEDDCNRSSIRFIRTELDLGNYLSAECEADKLAQSINLNSKTGIHYLILRSKIALILYKMEDFVKYSTLGLDLATAKKMQTEINIFNQLIEKNKDL